MAKRTHQQILKKQIQIRSKFWPDVDAEELWHMDNEGWTAVPRLMPLMMSIMDDMSGKGFPVSRTYFEMWCRLREEYFLSLNRPEEMAFHAGFEGQRALRTWKDRVLRLANMNFISLQPGPMGEISYALFLNPYYVVKRAHIKGAVQDRKWNALIMRANEMNIFDMDDIDEKGNLIPTTVPETKKVVPKAGKSRNERRGKPSA